MSVSQTIYIWWRPHVYDLYWFVEDECVRAVHTTIRQYAFAKENPRCGTCARSCTAPAKQRHGTIPLRLLTDVGWTTVGRESWSRDRFCLNLWSDTMCGMHYDYSYLRLAKYSSHGVSIVANRIELPTWNPQELSLGRCPQLFLQTGWLGRCNRNGGDPFGYHLRTGLWGWQHSQLYKWTSLFDLILQYAEIPMTLNSI